jgi:hypothetical protein
MQASLRENHECPDSHDVCGCLLHAILLAESELSILIYADAATRNRAILHMPVQYDKQKNGLIDATSRSISAMEFQDSHPPYRIEIIQYHSLVVFIEPFKIYNLLKYIELMLYFVKLAINLIISQHSLKWTGTAKLIIS